MEGDGHRMGHRFHEHHLSARLQILGERSLQKRAPIDVMKDGATNDQVEAAVQGIMQIMKPVFDLAFAVAQLLGRFQKPL